MWKITLKNGPPRTSIESACQALGADIIQTYWITNPCVTNPFDLIRNTDAELLQAAYGEQTDSFQYCPTHQLFSQEQGLHPYVLKRDDRNLFFADKQNWLPFGSHTVRFSDKRVLSELISQLKIPVTIYSDLTACRVLE